MGLHHRLRNKAYWILCGLIANMSTCAYASFSIEPVADATVYEGTAYTSPWPIITGSVNGSLSFYLIGLDSGELSVSDFTGVVSLSARDYENPEDANGDNIYQVNLVAIDSTYQIATTSWTIEVLDLPPLSFTIAPVADDSISENLSYTGPAMSISGTAIGPIQYVAVGVDQTSYSVDSQNGVVSMTPRDYEHPTDDNGDNIYQISVAANDADGNEVDRVTWQLSITDVADSDSDNDGVLDETEIAEGTDPFDINDFKDTDNDGTPDALESDSDADGIPNVTEDSGYQPYADNDEDAVADYLDADDRGDGQPANCTDIDSNAVCDLGQPLDPIYDFDQDGIANHADFDSDNDYLPDVIETATDTDMDGHPNYLDRDSDNDGIPDVVESGITASDSDGDQIPDAFDTDIVGGTDINGDGINDFVRPRETDGDGIYDYRDVDSDNDTIPDALEGPSGTDSNSNGIDDRFDVLITGGIDSNQDGITDGINAIDTDGDGTPDYLAKDSDGDGIGDQIESGSQGLDTDMDGIDDQFDADNNTGTDSNADGILENTLRHSDNDGAPDFRDLDADNDGLTDVYEAGGEDEDENGLLDADAPAITLPTDTDADLLADYIEVDSDNDGDFDILASGYSSFDANLDGQIDITTDPDADGIDNSVDTAPTQYGLEPRDTDGDGLTDDVDPDDDNDNISDLVEGDLDTDMDGIPDHQDPDSDNDGISDLIESGSLANIGDSNTNGIDDSLDVLITGGNDANNDGFDDAFLPVDSDGDGTPDYRDFDSDNDTVPDNTEATDTAAMSSDTDSDGIDDSFDVDISLGVDTNNDGIDDDIVPVPDTDQDGKPDYQDTDSDNDKIPDNLENDDINGDNIPDRLQADGEVKTAESAGSMHWLLLVLLSVMVIWRSATARKILAALSILASCSLQAETEWVCGNYISWPDSEPAFESCYYLGAGVGMSTLEPDTEQSSWNRETDSDSGFKVYGGYHFAPNWFAEFVYADLGKADMKSAHTLITTTETVAYDATALFAGYYLPVNRWIQLPVEPFVKLGMASVATTSSTDMLTLESEESSQLAAGFGAQWRFKPRWSLRAEYESFASDASLLSLSVAYWLGGKQHYYEVPPAPAPQPEPEPEVVVLDDDGDGIPNELDICASTPKGAEANEQGCAVYQGRLPDVNLQSDSTELTEASYEPLDKAVAALKKFPETHIEIQAHTDSRGTESYNQALSERRATAVMDYLIKQGISAERLSIRGFGETKPIADNKTAEGRAKNRRVEFAVVE